MTVRFKSACFVAGAFSLSFGLNAATAEPQFQPPQIPIDVCAPVPSSCNPHGALTFEVTQPYVYTTDPTTGIPRVRGQVHFDFDGHLQIGGVDSTPNNNFPLGTFFSPDLVDVKLSTAFDANVDATLGGAVGFQANPGFTYSNITKNVSSIDLNVENDDVTDEATGLDYDYELHTVDPKAIVDDSVQLSGTYHTESDQNAIIFGTLTGSATLLSGTENSEVFGQGYISPFAVQTQVTVHENTRLDANGLTTPTISVTDGINMNGSRVTNLGAGVAETDAVNKGQLDNESSARAAADVSLGNQLTNETSARMAAESNLATRLDAIDGRLDRDDRRADAGTAVAVAMGGGAFLPDMHFNLTANVATYNGAHAGAVQFGALVSPHVAVNVGIATAFNRGGHTAARTGVTFGW